MIIQASVGNAPRSASLHDTVYSLRLVAQTAGEKAWLAELLKAIDKITIDPWNCRLRAVPPKLKISENE